MKKRTVTTIVVLMMALVLAACGKKQAEEPKPFIDVSEDGKSIWANLDDADKDVAGGSGITVGENEKLVIDSAIEKGSVLVRIIPGGSDMEKPPVGDNQEEPVFEKSFTKDDKQEELTPEAGDYTIFVSVTEKSAGKITFTVQPAE